MTPTHAGTLAIVRESIAMFRDAIQGLSDEALLWKPGPQANSIAVLAVHSVTATRFFLKCGCGEVGSIAEYRRGERAAAFGTNEATGSELIATLQALSEDAEFILSAGTERQLTEAVTWPDAEPPVPTRTGAGSLVAAVGHLREHVGQAQLTRDLWLAR
jgi:uncharacterized damage-inducible protein DinB